MRVECYDVGGTKLRGAIIGPEGIGASLVESSARGDPSALFAQIQAMSARLGGDGTDALAVALPGPVSGAVMRGSRPLRIEGDVDFAAGLERLRGRRRIFVGNDLNFAARAELRRGRGKDCRNFALLTLSTGIGVGVVLDSKVVERRIELGHAVLELDPALAGPCQGHAGCWSAQASGSGIEALLARGGGKRTAKDFFDAPEPELLARIRRYNARGLGVLIDAFDPERVFVMGSIGLRRFELAIPTPDELAPFTALRPIPPIERTTLGDEIGLCGAYEAAAGG